MNRDQALRRTDGLRLARDTACLTWRKFRAHAPRSGLHAFAQAAFVLLAFSATNFASAQTTTGSSTLGQNYFGLFNATSNPTGKGCAGCHTATTASLANGINAGGHITYANTQGMGGQADNSGQQYNDIAAYLATQFAAQGTQAIPFQSATAFTIPNIVLNTIRGDYVGIRQVAAPSRGATTFTAGSLSVTYTPSAGQCGTDSFTYEAFRTGAAFPQGAGTSNLRTTFVNIANPAIPNISGSAGAISGVFNTAVAAFNPVNSGGTPLSFAITAGALPTGLSLNSATGMISGTPSQAGSFNVTLAARNCNSGNLAGQSGTKVISINIAQANQTISFGALVGKLTTDPAFTVAATASSALAVSFTASGVCSASGVNGSTITLTGAVGSCSVTASQGGNTNYAAAPSVIQSFNVTDSSAEVFPPNCAMPPGWTVPAGANTGWSIATDFASAGGCSLKSNPVPNLSINGPNARLQLSATFDAGTISLSRKVSSETNWKCFRVLIDDVQQSVGGVCGSLGPYLTPAVAAIGASGELPFATITIPIAAGSHTVVLSYDKDSDCCVQGADAAWVDQVSMPLSTAVTSGTFSIGTFGVPLNYTIAGSNFPAGFSATGLPPGLTLAAGSNLISGTPSAAGNYTAMVTVSNPAGVNPAATDTRAVSFLIGKAGQAINFPQVNNKLTTSPPFVVSATGGNSTSPVTFGASGVCSSSGVNGVTITLTGATGTCFVTASQLGDNNYNDASAITRSIEVTPPASEIFPAACTLPAGWTNTAGPGWTVSANEESATGACSLKSVSTAGAGARYQTEISFAGTFAAGNVTFKYRISTEPDYKCFQFLVDGVAQSLGGTCSVFGLVGISGQTGWVSVSVPITAGAHTLRWRYDKDSDCCTFGTRDAVWIDDVVLPQFTLTVIKAGTGAGTVSSNPAGINACAGTCSVALSGNVLLTPSPAFLSFFAGWSGGGCTGTGPCTVTMDASKSVTATFSPATAPSVLQNVVATPGNGSATISFNPPASDGGSPITAYGGNCAASGQTTVFAGSSNLPTPLLFSGLTNGVQYACTVSASNFAGGGAATVVNVTPRTVPSTPTNLAAASANASATLSFTASASNGGSAITGYTATCTAAGQTTRTATGLGSPLTVGTMVNGVAYSCSVVATNVAGPSAATAPVSVTPRTAPGAPVMPFVIPFDSRATIDWAAPGNDGGSPIIDYSVSCNGGSVTANAANGPVTLTGLANGTTYTCTVSANNAAGSTASPSFSFVPLVNTGTALWTGICTTCHAATPSGTQLNGAGPSIAALDYARANQPLMLADSRVQALTVAERAAIANYILAQIPTTAEVTPFQTPKIINLGTRITLPSLMFDSIKAGMTVPLHGTLSAVTGSSITYTPNAGYVGADSFTVTGSHDTAPAFTGSEITVNVTVQPPPVPVITSVLTATGTNGAPFNYQILASNAPTGYVATGLPSGLSVSAATGLISGTPGVGGSFNVTISASNQGGAGPTATLVITLNAAGQTITFPVQTSTSRAFSPGATFAISPLATASSGLVPTYVSKTAAVCTLGGTTVTIVSAGACTIGANQAGNVNFAAAVEVTRDVTITPTIPGPPVIGVASPGNNQAVVAFAAPANTGGIAVTGYTATCSAAGQATRTGTGAVSPIIVSSLVNLVQYSCSVTATNGQGTGPSSGNATVTPDQIPTAPTVVSGNTATFTVNAPGSFSVVATGYPIAFTYAITVGSLPAGVTLSPTTGVLSGTPTQAGSFPITLSVTNTGGTGTQPFTLTVNKANQTISFSNPGTRAFGSGTVALTAVATSGLAATFVSDTTGICTVSGSTATLVSVGTCTIRAQQAGNANFNAAPDVSQSFSVTQGTQSITFGAQTSPRAFSAGGTFAISPVATASSGLGVTHSSLTTGVCTVSGTTVTMVSAGICTIAANQPGNANVAAAAQVTQSITINGTAPGAPALSTATGGDQKITLVFTAPLSNGGSPITGYTATCGAFTATGSTSPIAVTGLTNGNAYTCSVTATNAALQTSASSNSILATANALPGATVWSGTCGPGCHGAPPSGLRLNVGGADSTVLDYSLTHATPVMAAMVSIVNLTLNAQQKNEVAQYIRDFIPAVSATTPTNTAVGINVSSQVILNTPSVALTSLQQASAPSNGTLSFPGGAVINYTPNNGFVGNDTFTYRALGIGVQTDVRTVSVTVTPAAPVITSAVTVSASIGQLFSYQIAASNGPSSYNATGLPAWANVSTTTGAITGTPNAGGSTTVTVSATGPGGTGNATLTITVNLAAQAISFPAQTVTTRVYASGGTFAIGPTATGGASGNPVVYSSTTTGVCTVSGTTVTIVGAGICTIAANQAGNASFAAAPQVTQNVTITGVAPAAPTIGTATAGNTQATIGFTPPANTGGLPITGYTVSCNGGTVTASGASAPIVVSGLTNGTLYTCSVQASNLAGSSPASATVTVTPVAIAFTGTVESRKLHGVAGLFVVPINPATPIGGAIAIEPRSIGSGHQIAFTFNNPPTSLTALTVLDAGAQPVGSASPSFAGNDLVITLTGVPDGKRVTITATGVNGAINVSASVGFLLGDVNGSGAVTATDIAAVKSRSSLTFDPAKFRADINANGAVTASDVTAVKAQAGKRLP